MDCVICGKKLRAYTSWREWKTRKSHYSCYKRSLLEWSFTQMAADAAALDKPERAQ
jgi:hypothetical protein